ncbi:hypothetical protein BDU57DRAFT_518485 [Ampelomyces quisqualis]|uniref:Uncharacterized protein n=1 Tax=Ampelomyces quisqualis TaxID=50730 RepID=A0A6A5QJD3_AMPQU|nr:hypothetical protein BDU57DRAFT_518485 [Ampelomyces quisqualis]
MCSALCTASVFQHRRGRLRLSCRSIDATPEPLEHVTRWGFAVKAQVADMRRAAPGCFILSAVSPGKAFLGRRRTCLIVPPRDHACCGLPRYPYPCPLHLNIAISILVFAGRVTFLLAHVLPDLTSWHSGRGWLCRPVPFIISQAPATPPMDSLSSGSLRNTP